MGFENTAGLNVHNHYGPRDTGGSAGVEHSKDSIHQLSVDITPASLNDGFVPPVYMPKGAKVLRYLLVVNKPITLTGTDAKVLIGTEGSEATNGIAITAADLSAQGTVAPETPSLGAWGTDSAFLSASKVGVVLGSGTTVSGTGDARLIVEFINKLVG